MSHFSSIGFKFLSSQEIFDFFNSVYDGKKGQETLVSLGKYYQVRDDSNVELFFQLSVDGELCGLTPYFHGETVNTVSLVQKITDPSPEAQLDGSFYAWMAPSDLNDFESGLYPFVFDVPNFLAINDIKIPLVVNVKLTGFAEDIKIFADEEEYNKSEYSKFAPQSFVPSGLFQDKDSNQSPQPQAIIIGNVLSSKELTNNSTKQKFYWVKVQTYGSQIDLVIDPILLDRLPKEGSIVQGTFWLVGTIAE